MKENSIERDITRIKQRIEDVKEYIEYGLPYSEYLDLENSFDNILSDYKRVLKENEELRAKWDKDTHILQNKLDYANADRIDLAQQNKELRKENEELNYKLHSKKIALEIYNRYIPKSKLKEFFSSRLEKYQEADDGKYEQDYLTRGELELVDRYKECKEIAKIILEEEINGEVPQNCIPTSLVKEKIEKLKENGYWNYLEERDLETTIDILQELLEKRK